MFATVRNPRKAVSRLISKNDLPFSITLMNATMKVQIIRK